jgi:hypothetical protein
MERDNLDVLEQVVDRVGLAKVLEALVQIAIEKAEHVSTAWGDKALAKSWEANARILEKASQKIITD